MDIFKTTNDWARTTLVALVYALSEIRVSLRVGMGDGMRIVISIKDTGAVQDGLSFGELGVKDGTHILLAAVDKCCTKRGC
jgi:hypothetical protein